MARRYATDPRPEFVADELLESIAGAGPGEEVAGETAAAIATELQTARAWVRLGQARFARRYLASIRRLPKRPRDVDDWLAFLEDA